MTRIVSLVLGFVALPVALVSTGVCTPGQNPHPTFEEISKLATRLGWPEPLHPDQLEVSRLKLRCLPRSAFLVRIHDRIPAREVVLIGLQDGWAPTLIDKEPADGWKSSIEEYFLLRSCEKARSLAADLARLAVDPVQKYGLVLRSPGSIPGLHSSAMTGVLASIHPPAIRETATERPLLDFFTWDYFGGEVFRWQVVIDERVKIERTQVGTAGLGRFGYYH